MLMEKCSVDVALEKIRKNLGLKQETSSPSKEREDYIYKDLNGIPVYRKVKGKDKNGKNKYRTEHLENDKWLKSRGPHESIPYNLPDSKSFDKAIVCEGEKDAETVLQLTEGSDLKNWVTSAPNGKGSWPSSLSRYFTHITEVTFIYDVGAEDDALKHAKKLYASNRNLKIYLARVPLEQEGKDITDFLDKFSSSEQKVNAFNEVMNDREKIAKDEECKTGSLQVESINELLSIQIPEIEKLVDPFVERNGLTLLGGVKGSGKSLFVINLGLYYSSGKSEFLKSEINKPGKVLYIQQEIIKSGLQTRISKIMMEETFDHQNRFSHITTTGAPLKLTDDKDFDSIRNAIEKREPDLVILDPLSTFNASKENDFLPMSKIVDKLNSLKTEFPIGLILTHHFSSKRNPDDPQAPSEVSGLFRGHTALSDSADILVGLLRLPQKFKNQALPLRYDHYLMLETQLRNGEAPDRYAIERGNDRLIFRTSSIIEDIGKKILPEEVLGLVKANDGKMLQQDVLEYFKDRAHFNTTRKAIDECVKKKRLTKETLPIKHGPVLLKVYR
ncbi:AAA family ATPase [Acidobacteriota bacterium]